MTQYINPFIKSMMASSVNDFNPFNPTDGTIAYTPKWIISADDIFKTQMAKFEKFYPCIEWQRFNARLTQTDSTVSLRGDGMIFAGNVRFRILAGNHSPTLQDKMCQGKLIKKITIHRVASIDVPKVPIRTTEFETCYISTFEHFGDDEIYTFSYMKIKDIFISYKADTKKEGQNVFELDMTKIISKVHK